MTIALTFAEIPNLNFRNKKKKKKRMNALQALVSFFYKSLISLMGTVVPAGTK